MPEKPPRAIVVLDANALMMPFQFGLNIDIELGRLMPGCEIIVPSSVIIELRAVLKRTFDPHAKAALSLAPKYRFIRADGFGDDSVLKMAKDLEAALVTNDKQMRSRAHVLGLTVIGLRGKNHLEIL
jgi:hypothetical protein